LPNGQVDNVGKIDKKVIFPQDIKLRTNVFKIRSYIYQAESLPPADKTGTSDPYVNVWTPAEKRITT